MRFVTSFRAIWEGGPNERWNSVGQRTDPVIVSYHFNDAFTVPNVWELDEDAEYVDPMDRFQQGVVRAQLEKLEDAAGIRFVEVDNPDLAMMTFSVVGGSDFGGWAYLPESYVDYTSTSDIFIDETGISFGETWARGVILHEVMHALGLTHPHEGRFRLVDWMDKPAYTLMTYNGFDDRLGSLDVEALRYLYGPSIDRADLRFTELPDGLRITGSAADDTIIGVKGNGELIGAAGDDILIGREDNDLLRGGLDRDYMSGVFGDDRLLGGGGNDRLFGGAGDDGLLGMDGADWIAGGSGVDLLLGGRGNDRLFGHAGGDELNGGNGTDRLHGGAGFDILRGEAGADVLTGGGGGDTFVFRAADGAGMDRITDFELGIDRLALGNRGFESFTLREAQGGASVDLLFDDAGQQLRLEGVTLDAFVDHYALD